MESNATGSVEVDGATMAFVYQEITRWNSEIQNAVALAGEEEAVVTGGEEEKEEFVCPAVEVATVYNSRKVEQILDALPIEQQIRNSG